jgi:hypothetical protein
MIALYIDPGTGSILVSSLIALIAVGFYMIKGFIYRKLNIGGSSGIQLDTTREYSLVCYSEGGQYWHVFKPILEELNARGIAATYFSSKEDDPGLQADLEHIEKVYVGSGRELYYFLNHVKADIVLMTTPGLDVLQIKRSKSVKHYCHVTHSAGGADMYKAFGLDYYDSVLVGGDEDLRFIREIEQVRGSVPKRVEIIGCTYLDVLRQKLHEVVVEEHDKPTVLLSPTWGEHGLLFKYGKQILSALEREGKYRVIVRPHPQSFVSEQHLMKELMTAFPEQEDRIWDRGHDGLTSMAQADIMVSDFSGIIFDYLFLFGKPVLTLNSQIEKRGRDAMDLREEPWGIRTLEKLDTLLHEQDIDQLPQIIEDTLRGQRLSEEALDRARQDMDKYPSEAGTRGADFICEIIDQLDQQGQDLPVKPHMEKSHEVLPSGIVAKALYGVKLLGRANTWFQLFFALLIFNAYLLIGSQTFPSGGYNDKFFTMGLPLAAYTLVGVCIMWLILMWIRDRGSWEYNKEHEKFSAQSLLVLFLPMTPVVQYIIANQDILTFGDSLVVGAFFLVISAVLTVGISWLLSSVIPQLLTMTVTLSLIFHVLNMANLVSLFSGEKRLQVAVFFLAALVIFLLLAVNKKLLYIFAIIFFVVNIATALFQSDETSSYQAIEQESGILNFTAQRTPVHTPDVYLMIYESYANQEMLDYYGYDNSEQLNFLLDQGFAIYDGIYTVGPRSLLSIAHLLHVDPLARFANRRDIIAKDAHGLAAFKAAGYSNHSIMTNDYMIRGSDPLLYDEYYPNPTDPDYSVASSRIIIDAVLEGQFRVDAEFSRVSNEMYVTEKRKFLAQEVSQPRFLYTHNNYPGHSPDTGVLRPNETQLYLDKFAVANEEMRQDIQSHANANRDAIIIIAGDHGPYLTKNGKELETYAKSDISRIDVQDRYGVFLAIKWPEKEIVDQYDIDILQDVLPAVFAYLYDDENIFTNTRLDRETLYTYTTGGVGVQDGIIVGGADDGKPLFDNTGVRLK